MVLLLWIFYVFSVLCLLCFCMHLFICALWSPAGKGLTSWLSFVVSNCKFVTFPLVSWVRCGTWLYWFLIFAPLLTLLILLQLHMYIYQRRSNLQCMVCILSISYCMVCAYVQEDNLRALASELSPIYTHNHTKTFLLHQHTCPICTLWDSRCKTLGAIIYFNTLTMRRVFVYADALRPGQK